MIGHEQSSFCWKMFVSIHGSHQDQLNKKQNEILSNLGDQVVAASINKAARSSALIGVTAWLWHSCCSAPIS